MQYLLTQEEIDNLVPLQEIKDRDIALTIARKMILKESNFKCIHEQSNDNFFDAVCDACPCSPLIQKEYKIGKLICNLRTEYSQ